jgi:hypothetical protein
MSNIQEKYMKEVKKEFVDRVKLEIREKLSKTKTIHSIAKHLKVHLFAIMAKTPNHDLLEPDQEEEIVNKAYRVLHPMLTRIAKEQRPKSTIKSRFMARPSFLRNVLGKTRKATPSRNATPNVNMTMATRSKNVNVFGMNSMLRALNDI